MTRCSAPPHNWFGLTSQRRNKNGKPLAGLNREDFELKVNGVPQAIDTFTVASEVIVPPMTLPRGTFSNKQAVAEVSHGRYTVFLLDWRNTNFMLQSWAHQQLLKMLSETPPGGKVALYLINNGFQIVQEFTSDLDLIREKAAALEGGACAAAVDHAGSGGTGGP